MSTTKTFGGFGTSCPCCPEPLLVRVPKEVADKMAADPELAKVCRVAAFIAGGAAACNGISLADALCSGCRAMAEEALQFTSTPWPPVEPPG